MAYGLQDFYKTATRYGFARNNLLRLQNISGDTRDNKPIFPIKQNNIDFYI